MLSQLISQNNIFLSNKKPKIQRISRNDFFEKDKKCQELLQELSPLEQSLQQDMREDIEKYCEMVGRIQSAWYIKPPQIQEKKEDKEKKIDKEGEEKMVDKEEKEKKDKNKQKLNDGTQGQTKDPKQVKKIGPKTYQYKKVIFGSGFLIAPMVVVTCLRNVYCDSYGTANLMGFISNSEQQNQVFQAQILYIDKTLPKENLKKHPLVLLSLKSPKTKEIKLPQQADKINFSQQTQAEKIKVPQKTDKIKAPQKTDKIKFPKIGTLSTFGPLLNVHEISSSLKRQLDIVALGQSWKAQNLQKVQFIDPCKVHLRLSHAIQCKQIFGKVQYIVDSRIYYKINASLGFEGCPLFIRNHKNKIVIIGIHLQSSRQSEQQNICEGLYFSQQVLKIIYQQLKGVYQKQKNDHLKSQKDNIKRLLNYGQTKTLTNEQQTEHISFQVLLRKEGTLKHKVANDNQLQKDADIQKRKNIIVQAKNRLQNLGQMFEKLLDSEERKVHFQLKDSSSKEHPQNKGPYLRQRLNYPNSLKRTPFEDSLKQLIGIREYQVEP